MWRVRRIFIGLLGVSVWALSSKREAAEYQQPAKRWKMSGEGRGMMSGEQDGNFVLSFSISMDILGS